MQYQLGKVPRGNVNEIGATPPLLIKNLVCCWRIGSHGASRLMQATIYGYYTQGVLT